MKSQPELNRDDNTIPFKLLEISNEHEDESMFKDKQNIYKPYWYICEIKRPQYLRIHAMFTLQNAILSSAVKLPSM